MQALGWDERWAALTAAAADELKAESTPGRVLRHDGALVTVATADGPEAVPVLASIDPPPVVGDWVLISDLAVRATLPRTSLLRRRDTTRDVEQAIVANVDIVFIVCGLDRPLSAGRVQRATALAVDAGAQPIIVLTKSDKVDDPDAIVAEVVEANPDVDVLITSSREGDGIDELRQRTAGFTVVMIGESGAGKSRLTNALCEDEVALVGDVREGDSKGRHTTSHREIHLLANGGILVDTPGIRSVGLWTDTEAVDATFDDVEELAAGCRFSDCAHQGEPGCAVQAAIEAGDLDPARLAAWRGLVDEADQAARRQEAKAWRQGEGRAPRNQTRRGRARVPDDPEDD